MATHERSGGRQRHTDAREQLHVRHLGGPVTTTHNSVGDLGFRFLYVGQFDVQWDNDFGLGLLYMHARHYDPALGRFMQPDPSTEETNLYAYTANNPVTRADPDGTKFVQMLGMGGPGGARGGGLAAFYRFKTPTICACSYRPISNAQAYNNFRAGERQMSRPRNPDGGRGKPAHRKPLTEAERRLLKEEKGNRYVSGGSGPEKQYTLPSGKKRRPDLVIQLKNGKLICIQSGLRTKGGVPIKRERDALRDLRGSGLFKHCFFVAYRR